MSITPNLVFFNKQGYPYNFTLNDGIWTGKIFFEPGSTDLFKSLTLYTLESVDPIEYEGSFNIVNKEIYNDSGMTLSPGNYTGLPVTDILSVNQSSSFYTKWVYGKNFNRYFPKGTVISFTGNANHLMYGGEADFSSGKYYVVLQTVKDAIMIATQTTNNIFSFIFYSGTNTFYVNAHDCVSIPDADKNLMSNFNIQPNEKISVVGTSNNNDGVYEVSGTSYTYSRIFDFNLSGLTTFGDYIHADLTLLTERPLLYQGDFIMSSGVSGLYASFPGGRNSNITVGTKFICEDVYWNHLLMGNEYEITEIITENNLGTATGMTFTGYTSIEDDGTLDNIYYIRMLQSYGIQEGWNIRFDSGGTINDKLVKTITNITTGTTLVGSTGVTYYNFYFDTAISFESGVTYTLTHVLKPYEQETVKVTSSIDNSEYDGYARVLSITNKVRYSQQIPTTGTSIEDALTDAIDMFVMKYGNIFEYNGIDVYRKNDVIIFDGRYSGGGNGTMSPYGPYFYMSMSVNTGTTIPIDQEYSLDSLGSTYYYNVLLKPSNITYERLNMSDNLSQPYSADILLELFDDIQDYGFQIQLNGIQYYVPFNNNSGITTYTIETIKDFVTKYYNIFYYNGLELSTGTTLSGSTYWGTLFINGLESNVDVWETKVKVNKNSSYILKETTNRCMMITANQIVSLGLNFTQLGLATGMIVSVSGSTYPSNNKEFNIIGLDNDTLELSYQGPMYSESGINLSLKTREFLRRPRETNDSDIIYRFRWEEDVYTSIFLYDLSGENLVPWGNNSNYAYTGPKPLVINGSPAFLNKEPNKSVNSVSIPYQQQTVFDQLDFTLQRYDDDNASILPHPIETFIGYNNPAEGVDQRNLIIERVDNISYTGTTVDTDTYFVVMGNTITMVSGSTTFLNVGFKSNRYIRIKFNDRKQYTQEVFEDYLDYLVLDITNTTIKVDGTLTTFTTYGQDFDFEFLMLPERIAYFRLFGETESEDERLEANLKLLGISLTEEDEYIFKQSDVTEDGIDYRLLNKKRKEMMNVFTEIYNYIGSYRAILNAIDFFGYTDVELVEYYRNIDKTSPYYKKLKRVVIPDLLDRQVEGWTYSEEIPNNMEYVKTSLLNLTYRITDEDGNNVYLYTLKEVQTKLNGMKKWLRRNVVPINSNIRDITGVSEVLGTNWRRFDPGTNFQKNVISQTNEAVNVN